MAKEDTEDQCTQAFRASTSKEILDIPTRLDNKTGQHIVLWKDIQLGFENAKCIKKGGALVLFLTDENFDLNPLRIGHHPGVVLDVIQVNSGNNESEGNKGGANESAIFNSSDSSLTLESESGLLFDTPATSEIGVDNASAADEDNTEGKSSQTGDPVDIGEISETANNLSISSVDDGGGNLLTQIRARGHTMLSQTYELHKNTIPRLFIVLPKTTRLHDRMKKPFFNQFQLFFLCECGAHTLSKGTKLKHEIHFTNHAGYALDRPIEFFQKCGSYILAMMLAVKHGVTAPGHVITPLAYLNFAKKFNSSQKDDALTKNTALMDAMITFLQEQDGDHLGRETDSCSVHSELDSTSTAEMEGLQELKSYLRVPDQDNGFGGLCRFVTPEGHVKWICSEHYREIYKAAAIKQLQNIVKSNNGIFNLAEGKIIITLISNSSAKQLYSAMINAGNIQELEITLQWDATLDDLRAFAAAIIKANIVRLSLNGFSFKKPSRDYANDSHRYDPLMQLMSNGRLQSFQLKEFNCFYLCMSISAVTMAPRLRTLSFASDVDLKTAAAQSVLSHILGNSPSLVELSLETEEIHFLFDIISEKLSLLPHLSTMRVYYRSEDEPTLTVDYSRGKISAATLLRYRKENISVTDREVFETGQLSKVIWKGTPQQEDEVKLLDILCRNPKLTELRMECDPSRIPGVINLIMSTRKSILSRGRPFILGKLEFVQDPASVGIKDVVTSTIEFSETSGTIKVSTDINMQSLSPRSNTDSLYEIFHQQGWSINILETNMTFNDDLAQLLDTSTQFKGSKFTKLLLDTNSLSSAGLDRMDRVISLSYALEHLDLRLDELDEASRLRKLVWLVGRHGSRLNSLTLHSKSPDFWIQQFAEAIPTRSNLPVLEDFHLLCFDSGPKDIIAKISEKTVTSKTCIEWIAAMVSSQPHVIWSSTRPSTPDIFVTNQSLISTIEPPKAWTSLRSISLNGIHLQSGDWLTVIEAIDFSALESLSFIGSNFDLEQLEILVDCILDDDESQVPLSLLQLNFTNLVDYMDDEAPWALITELGDKAPLLVIQGLERPE
ncbi:hypothetical protein BGZ46_004656 [Entomortierella lignicola]|nr:hypothetical protein BGZ46_004656 [Entomortierella lignicola]